MKLLCLTLASVFLSFFAAGSAPPPAVSAVSVSDFISDSAAASYPVISAEEARAMLQYDKSVVVLDVRTPEEFASVKGHLKGAILIPVQELEKRARELNAYKKRRILAYCCACPRSAEACAILSKRGFTVVKMEGGIDAWTEAKYPVVVEKKAGNASCSTRH